MSSLKIRPAQPADVPALLAMMAHLARLANERGCARFEWSVLDWNEPAIRFYESIGATVLPDWRVCRMTGDALARLGQGAGTAP